MLVELLFIYFSPFLLWGSELENWIWLGFGD